MRGQSSPAGPCKYLHNNDKKKLCKIFAKERKEKNLKIHRKTPLSG